MAVNSCARRGQIRMQLIQGGRGADAIQALHREVVGHYRKSLEAKMPFISIWRQCHAFYNGDHYGQWSPVGATLQKAPAHRVRIVNNRIAVLAHTVMAKGLQNRPMCECYPRQTTRAAQQRAKTGTLLLRYLDDVCDITSACQDYWFWKVLTGNGFYRWEWDDDVTTQPFPRPRVVAESPFNVYPDVMATTLRNARHVTIAHRVLREDIVQEFGAQAAEGASGTLDGDAAWRSQISGYVQSVADDSVLLFEHQVAPRRDAPEGRRIYSTSARVVHVEESLPNRKYTLSHGKAFPMGGRFWGRSMVQDPIWIQVELNRTASQIIEIRNLTANPQWVVAKGTLATDAVLNSPGKKIEWDPSRGPRPELTPAPPVPTGLFELLAVLESSLEKASGVHDISTGARPDSGDPSGRALEVTADQDQAKMTLAVLAHERAMEELYQGIFWMWRNFQDRAVTVEITGRDRAHSAVELHAVDLDDLNVRVIAGSGAPTRPSYTRAALERLLAMGALPADTMGVWVRELLGHRLMDSVTDDDSDGRLFAREENAKLQDPMQAQTVRVEYWHDDASHIAALLEVMETERFGELPPETVVAFRQHLAWHMHNATLKAQGMPLYGDDLGMQMPQPMQMPQSGHGAMGTQTESTPPTQRGVFDGGTPELNGSDLTGAPGVDEAVEAMGGDY